MGPGGTTLKADDVEERWLGGGAFAGGVACWVSAAGLEDVGSGARGGGAGCVGGGGGAGLFF